MTVKPIDDKCRNAVNKIIADEWNGPIVVSKGAATDTSTLPGFVFQDGETLVGAVTYHIVGNECEIVTLNSFIENKGVGSSLINAIKDAAKGNGCDRLWLTTTNDNSHAFRYYQKIGFSMCGVRLNVMHEYRKLKPSIPLSGNDGIPILHELEFEMRF